MDWLVLIPVTAAAIGLYAWFKPPSVSEWPDAEFALEIEPAPQAEREQSAAVAVLHAAEQQDNSALIHSR